MVRPVVAIRADGGDYIGMGHLMRTGVIADELKAFTDVMYICSKAYPKGIHYLEKKGYKVLSYDEDEILEKIGEVKATILITDHYGIDDRYMKSVRNNFYKVGYIDDIADKAYIADFIINQNYGAEELNYKVNSSCKLLLGSEYTLIREEFRKVSPVQVQPVLKNIFVSVGGSDNYNITGQILEKLIHLPYNFHIVIGSAFSYQNELIRNYKKNTNIKFYNQPKMSELISKCDIGIIGCGSTVYELGVMGLPAIGIILADNQRRLAEKISQSGGLLLAGEYINNALENLDCCIMKLNSYEIRQHIHKRQLSLFNKDGVEKVIEVLKNI